MPCNPDATHYTGCPCHEERRDAERDALAARVATLTTALEFYADQTNWFPSDNGQLEIHDNDGDPYSHDYCGPDDPGPALLTGGKRAREALAATGGD